MKDLAFTSQNPPIIEGHAQGQIARIPGKSSGSCSVSIATGSQRRLWFIHEVEGGSAAYQIVRAVRLKGVLDISALRAALDGLMARHESLRTIFESRDGEPVQIITPPGCFSLAEFDLRGQEFAAREQQVGLHKIAEVRNQFDLQKGPLVRGRLIRIGNYEYILIFAIHHIVCDGWSLNLFARELSRLYASCKRGESSPLIPLKLQYADYAQWHMQFQLGPEAAKDLDYWCSRLLGTQAELSIPCDYPRPAVRDTRGDSVTLEFSSELSRCLRLFAQNHSLTLFMILYGTLAILISRLSGQSEVVIGAPIAGRPYSELEDIIGFFSNTVALRVWVRDHVAVTSFFAEVRSILLDAHEHQHADFESVVARLHPQRDLGRNPIFQVMIALEHLPPDNEFRLAGLLAIPEPVQDQFSIMDLMLSVEERDGELSGRLTYATSLFNRSTIERWGSSLVLLLNSIVGGSCDLVGNLPILPEKERQRIVAEFNCTATEYPRSKSIHQIFGEHVGMTPNALAIVTEQGALTYAELNSAANRLAEYLAGIGVIPGDYVPVVMRRSASMVTTQIALLKLGAVYIPVDPDQPVSRQKLILCDCQARWVLGESCFKMDLSDSTCRWIEASNADRACTEISPREYSFTVPAMYPAYVMYTSGSTGAPKGVVVPHRAVVRLVVNCAYVSIVATDRTAHCSNPAFDAATFEVWAALLNGASVLVVPQSIVLDPQRLCHLIERERVTHLWLTIGLLRQYAPQLVEAFRSVKCLITGGDVVDSCTIKQIKNDSATLRVLNGYGPTEGTTFTTTYEVESLSESTGGLPIGRPIANTRAYILDSEMRPQPIGVSGDLYIGGDGVALGYLHRPELTAERFVPDFFAPLPSSRLYKTGDSARWRVDGTIEFLGRTDNQLKLRGFRIEIGEIEAQLASHPKVRESAVVAKHYADGELALVAYLVSQDPTADAVSANELRSFMKMLLPEYMIPRSFVLLDNFPLTPNGKIDRRALGARVDTDQDSADRADLPRGRLEVGIAEIWRELLQIRTVGRSQNFFDLGGHSLLVVKLQARINLRFHSAITVANLYRFPTIQEIASQLTGVQAEDRPVSLSREATLNEAVTAIGNPTMDVPTSVLLTGGTGFVGRFLLAELMQTTSAKIFCMVRERSPERAYSRLRGTLISHGLWSRGIEQRLVAIPGNLREPRLGIEPAMHHRLIDDLDCIYHCGASMNHLETYTMAKPANVDGVRELIDMATQGKPKLINHVSSLSIFCNPPPGRTRIVYENNVIDHEEHSLSSGYATSKWVADKLLLNAIERGVPCNIFRLGLVGPDSIKGRYDEFQREYRIFRSCLLTGAGIKNYWYDPPPIPVDYVAHAIVRLSIQHPRGGHIFHLSSPHPRTCSVFERCNEIAETSLNIMLLTEWIREMSRRSQLGEALPIAPLVDTLNSEDMANEPRVRFDCSLTHERLRALGITIPVFDDDYLRLQVEALRSTLNGPHSQHMSQRSQRSVPN